MHLLKDKIKQDTHTAFRVEHMSLILRFVEISIFNNLIFNTLIKIDYFVFSFQPRLLGWPAWDNIVSLLA